MCVLHDSNLHVPSCCLVTCTTGFSIYGHVQRNALLRKGGLAPGQALLLTKPLGTGTIMAAAMRGAAKGRWVAAAVDSMQQSSGPAAAVLQAHGCAACTDVTGFGLAGHMVEMARASEAQVRMVHGLLTQSSLSDVHPHVPMQKCPS